MSQLLEKARRLKVLAMKGQDNVARNILSLLIGEVETKAKRDGVVPDDTFVSHCAKKIIDANNDAMKLNGQNFVLQEENTILQDFIPTQLNVMGIRQIIKNLIETNQASSVKDVMVYMQKNHPGQYDGKIASTIAKEML